MASVPKITYCYLLLLETELSVVSADFVKSPAGQYTSDFELDPGKGKDIEITIVSSEVGEFKVTFRISYYLGDNKDDNGYEEVKLDTKARPRGQNAESGTDGQGAGQPGNPPKGAGFETTLGAGILTVSYLYIRKSR